MAGGVNPLLPSSLYRWFPALGLFGLHSLAGAVGARIRLALQRSRPASIPPDDPGRWLSSSIESLAGADRPLVAYCVPVMDRMDDLESTLPHNLEAIRPFAPQAQLVVGCFDSDTRVRDWIEKQHGDDLAEGLLVFRALGNLERWHCAKAKNALGVGLRARYYASLDADNYLSVEDVGCLLALLARSRGPCIVHHFSGRWRDGTSGRLCFPARESGPYLQELLPRQFDEFSAILTLLSQIPDVQIVSRCGVNVLATSPTLRDYLRRNGITPDTRQMELGTVPPPRNPALRHSPRINARLRHLQRLNALYSLWRLSPKPEAKRHYWPGLLRAQHAYARSRRCLTDRHDLFSGPGLEELAPQATPTVYAIYDPACGDGSRWLDYHHAALGIPRLIVVDPSGSPSLAQSGRQAGVVILSPLFGCRESAAGFWLECLIHAFQTQGSWAGVGIVGDYPTLPAPQHATNWLQSLDATGIDRVDGFHAGTETGCARRTRVLWWRVQRSLSLDPTLQQRSEAFSGALRTRRSMRLQIEIRREPPREENSDHPKYCGMSSSLGPSIRTLQCSSQMTREQV